MASPGYQAGLSPRDMRIPVNQLGASMQPQTTAAVTASAAELGQQLNSAQTRIAQLEGELRRTGDAAERQFITAQINRLQQYAGQLQQNMQGAASPQNFTVVSPTPPTAAAPVAPANRMLPAPSAQGTLNMLRAEDARRGQMSRALGQQAEQQAAAAEAGARQPARGGTVFELDPVTGRLVPVDTTLRGATPDIQIIESTGKSLSGAVNKATAGRMFDLTAAEKIAFDKTSIFLLVLQHDV
jgi:hypothetical protein